MKNTLILLLCLMLNVIIMAQGTHRTGIEKIYVDAIPVKSSIATVTNNLPSDAVCYRIFIDMAPQASFSSIVGFSHGHIKDQIDYEGASPYPIDISTTTEFFNTAVFGSALGEDIQVDFLAFDSSLMYDSFISVGSVTNEWIGVPTYLNSNGYVEGEAIETTTTPGFDLTMLGNVNSSESLYTSDGVWAAVLPTKDKVKGPVETDSTIVFIGQFTTNGIFSFSINTGLIIPSGANYNLTYSFATGKWNNKWNTLDDVGNTVIQFTPLANVYGPAIEHPVVSIPFGADGDTVVRKNVPFLLKANASDNDGNIDSVEFRVNDVVVGIDYTEPYEIEYTASNPFIFTTVAIDNDGAVTLSDPVNVITSDNNLLPEIKFTKPTDNYLVAKDSTITAIINVADYDGYIDTLYLIINDSVYATFDTVINKQVEYKWTVSKKGNFTLKAYAIDNEGGFSEKSIGYRVGISPQIELTEPLNNSNILINSSTNLVASTSDSDGTIDYVVFYVNNQLLDTIKSEPYEISWLPSVQGTYVIKAVAADNDGLLGISSPITVNIGLQSNLVNRTENGSEVKVYPNPVDNILNLSINSEQALESGTVQIIDQLSKILISQKIQSGQKQHTIQLDITDFEPGIYIVQIQLNNSLQNISIIKY
ncbi:MAG: T9SS type A sorting domain-containing protein [Bacteroidales bacterium]|nr:T9SS type A sorting domain-containing protein [Bacteroidales bacterium]MBN2820054.1 T9SS type A sorting domain-containing protein [Bacteroidales bacterium]